MDASSTLARLAAAMDSARDLTVVTNGQDAFNTLAGRPGITPVLTGGRLEPRTASLVGPVAAAAASHVLLGTLFLSAGALDPDLGASEESIEEAEVKRSLAAVANTIVLAVDSSKLGQRAVARTLEWERVGMLVTELDPADPRLDPYREQAAIL
jgi:DeoR family fructose operon transcriptional repressor